ncbi:MAG TPA: DUF2232 domain-containing protein [Xanthobacteraceae bacterium]|nr:DUF2232 domain-containing protein [Xanthobacteraceae bacterium]
MLQILLVAIGAGAAAALLFASVATGSLVATLLFYLASLPILIAAMGWSHVAGLLGALIAATGLGFALGFYFFLAFLFGVGLPAWWLGYLALLGRSVGANGSADSMEWYPIGRLVFWAAIIGACVIIVGVLNFGTDKETFQTEIRSAFERALKAQGQTQIPGRVDTARVIDILVAALPPAAAVLLTILNTFNLWLAARVVKVSGRLRRPWPDLSAMTLPNFTPGVLAAAIAGSFLPDLAGVLAGVLAASLFMAYALMGFAVLHAVTRNMSGRTFALIGAYFTVVVFGWPILAMSMLGLAESAFNIRARFAAPAAGPPATRT